MDVAFATKAIVPISVVSALAIVIVLSLRAPRSDVRWWQRGVAWLALAKGTRFVLEFALCGEIVTQHALQGAATRYQAVVCAIYVVTAPLLVVTALHLLRGERRARQTGLIVAVALVAIEIGLFVARKAFALEGVASEAIGIAAVSLRGSLMMVFEAVVIVVAVWFAGRRRC